MDDSIETRQLPDASGVAGRLGKKGKVMEASYCDDRYESSDAPLSVAKKRKVKEDVTFDDRKVKEDDYMQINSQQQLDDTSSLKKQGKRKLKDGLDAFELGNSEPPICF
ncbi:hypothetical protein U1Q18_013714 [Sarracenia purpurea var. burkii]